MQKNKKFLDLVQKKKYAGVELVYKFDEKSTVSV